MMENWHDIKRRFAVCMLLLLIAAGFVSPPAAKAASVKVGRNIDIRGESLPDRQVLRPSIAVDPRNPDIIVAGAEDLKLVPPGGCWSADRCHRWDEYFRSTDGGKTWSSRLIPGYAGDTSPEGMTSPLRHNGGSAVAHVVFDRSGNVYFIGVTAQNFTDSGFVDRKSLNLFVAKFANDGADFVRITVLNVTGVGPDFHNIAVDTSGGPNDGNVYLTFLHIVDLGYNGGFARSTDGGLTFSKPVQSPGAGLPTGVTVDAAGNVFVASLHCTGHTIGCTSDASATILVAKSTDGGLTFGTNVIVAAIKPLPDPLPGNLFVDAVTIPPIVADASGVFIVWDDFGTGDADAFFTRSTDGGLSWSSPLRINDVTQGDQFFPAIASSSGVISVAWYDSRLGTLPNGTITKLDVFYAESSDGGLSFSRSVRVTGVSFDPNLVAITDSYGTFEPELGDWIGIAASPGAVHAIWNDNRNACDTLDPTFGCVDKDVYTATISGSITSKSDQIPAPITPSMLLLATLAASVILALRGRRLREPC